MNKKKNKIRGVFILVVFLSFIVSLVPSVLAHCPLCTAATGAAVVATREAGLNDAIVGVFVGGLIISTGLWFNNILKKRVKPLPLQGVMMVLISFILTIITLKTAGLLNGLEKLFGLNSLVVGSIAGTLLSIVAFSLSNQIKKKSGKTLFPFQTIVLTLVMLVIAAFIFYFLTK